MILIKQFGVKIIIICTILIHTSCIVREEIHVETDTLVKLKVPKYNIEINYFSDYKITNAIHRKERYQVLRRLHINTSLKKDRPLIIYKASTKLSPLFNEYLIYLGIPHVALPLQDSLINGNTLCFIFKNKTGDSFMLVHTWKHDSKQIDQIARSEFKAIISTIVIK